MKVIVLRREFSHEFTPSVDSAIIPDSAIIKDRKPFFVPPIDNHWGYHLALAFRISRLGKNIQSRFAYRYVDAMTTAIVTRPLTIDIEQCSNGLHWAYEGTLMLGEWQPLPADEKAPITVNVLNKTFAISNEIPSLYEEIAHVSKYATLKMGDMIISGMTKIGEDLPLETRIQCELNSTEALYFKIK